MQGEIEIGQSAATWLRDAGAAAVILILGGVLWAILKKSPSLIPASHHRERIAALEAQLARAEAQSEEWKELTLNLLTPLEKTLGDTARQQGKRG